MNEVENIAQLSDSTSARVLRLRIARNTQRLKGHKHASEKIVLEQCIATDRKGLARIISAKRIEAL